MAQPSTSATPPVLNKETSDAQWAEQFAQSAAVLDVLAVEASEETLAQPFVDDQAW